jgi:hypothetical protein
MNGISTNPPITILSFRVESRTDAVPENYNNALAEWAGNSPDRLEIAEQIRQQGGEHAQSLHLLDMNVYAEAPPLPPLVNEVVLGFTSTNINHIKGIITKLVDQALENVPDDYRLDIYIGSDNVLDKTEVQNLISDIYTNQLATTRNDICLKPLEEYDAGAITSDTSAETVATEEEHLDSFEEFDDEFEASLPHPAVSTSDTNPTSARMAANT